MPLKSHLYEYHAKHGKLTEFSGFEMPLWYTSIIDEHLAVRNAAGLFDVSHMGRLWITGEEATRFLQKLLPTDCAGIEDGRAFYTVMCNDQGGIIDDVIVNKFSAKKYMMIVNAGNRQKDASWILKRSQEFGATVEDFSNDSALIAFQGPLAISILQGIVEKNVREVRRFSFINCKVDGENCLISRTGYTGEDGVEITVLDSPLDDPARAMKIWNRLLDLGKSQGVLPCGLGARDSLRLEAGMCLYSQDIDETTSPIEAALENLVNLDDKRDFPGKTAIESQIKNGAGRRRVAFSMLDQGIPRHGHEIFFADKNIGNVTSGTFSPVLKKGIGMGYVPTPLSDIARKLTIKIRDAEKLSEIVRVPFYDTSKFGSRRKAA